MVFLLCLFAVSVVFSADASAPSFYLSAHGADSASGTSPGTAWATLGRLARASAHGELPPGSTALLRRGDTFLLGGPLNITGLPNPFTFSSYAAVDVSLVERPLIARDPTAWKDGKGILLNLHGVDGGIRMVGIGFRGGEVGVGFTWRPTRPQVVRGSQWRIASSSPSTVPTSSPPAPRGGVTQSRWHVQ